jgi:hypothetical protein
MRQEIKSTEVSKALEKNSFFRSAKGLGARGAKDYGTLTLTISSENDPFLEERKYIRVSQKRSYPRRGTFPYKEGSRLL